jgi:SH3 domain
MLQQREAAIREKLSVKQAKAEPKSSWLNSLNVFGASRTTLLAETSEVEENPWLGEGDIGTANVTYVSNASANDRPTSAPVSGNAWAWGRDYRQPLTPNEEPPVVNIETPDWTRQSNYTSQFGSNRDEPANSPPSLNSRPASFESPNNSTGLPSQFSSMNYGGKYEPTGNNSPVKRTAELRDRYSQSGGQKVFQQPGPTSPRFPSPPAVSSTTSVTALYDFYSSEGGELSFTEGQRIRVLQKDVSGSGWSKGVLLGKTGLFPTNFCQ